jgi:uncharacterized membrane protein
MTYLWLKAGHIIFVIFWMAGLFMLPRYFIYAFERTQEKNPAELVEMAEELEIEGAEIDAAQART